MRRMNLRDLKERNKLNWKFSKIFKGLKSLKKKTTIKQERKNLHSSISNACKQKFRVWLQKNNSMSMEQSFPSFTISIEIWNMWFNLIIKITKLELLHTTILNSLVFQRKNSISNVMSFLEKFQSYFSQERAVISISWLPNKCSNFSLLSLSYGFKIIFT